MPPEIIWNAHLNQLHTGHTESYWSASRYMFGPPLFLMLLLQLTWHDFSYSLVPIDGAMMAHGWRTNQSDQITNTTKLYASVIVWSIASASQHSGLMTFSLCWDFATQNSVDIIRRRGHRLRRNYSDWRTCITSCAFEHFPSPTTSLACTEHESYAPRLQMWRRLESFQA